MKSPTSYTDIRFSTSINDKKECRGEIHIPTIILPKAISSPDKAIFIVDEDKGELIDDTSIILSTKIPITFPRQTKRRVASSHQERLDIIEVMDRNLKSIEDDLLSSH